MKRLDSCIFNEGKDRDQTADDRENRLPKWYTGSIPEHLPICSEEAMQAET